MSDLPELPAGEMDFLTRILSKDAKNYHVWSYRQWLVRHFGLWPDVSGQEVEPGAADVTARKGGAAELRFVDALLLDDVRNNSAWNHRFFMLFGREVPAQAAPAVYEREIDYAKRKVARAPQNLAAWNYLRGVVRHRKRSDAGAANTDATEKTAELAELEGFAKEFADVEGPIEEIRSTHAVELLAEVWSGKGDYAPSRKAYEVLDKVEPIRKGYWNYKKQLIQSQGVGGKATA